MTVTTTGTGDYHLILETTDILYDYSDTCLLACYPTLELANSSARSELLKHSEEEPEEGNINSDGGIVLTTSGTEDLDLLVQVVYRPSPPEGAFKTIVYVVLKSVGERQELLGVYRTEEKASNAAQEALRGEAGIKSWRDRRKMKSGEYREGYDLETGFEGEWKNAEGVVVKVAVEGRELE